MNFLEKLSLLMNERGLNNNTLSKQSGVPYTTIDGFFKKGYEGARVPTIKKLASYFDVSLDYLMDDNVNDRNYGKKSKFHISGQEIIHIKKYRTLDEYGKKAVSDLLETEFERCESYRTSAKADTIEIKMSTLSASAGTGEYLEDEGYRQIYVKRTATAEQADFAVKVNGNSMEDTYYDGDILLVENTPHINVGDIGVFTVNGEGYVKEYGGDRLISHNDEYDDILLHDYDMVLCSGRVIGVAEFVK